MAKPVFEIRFPADAAPEIPHRALNFVEEIDRELRKRAIGKVSEINRYGIGVFEVSIEATRFLGTAEHIIQKLRIRHHLESEATVRRY